MKKVGMVSLGCDKNRVDSENVLFTFKKAGYKIVQDGKDADVILINTCAFIDKAKEESIDTILEFAALKEGTNKKLIVLGCLAERYGAELEKSMPEADAFVGINSYHDIVSIVESDKRLLVKNEKQTYYEKGRLLTTPAHYAYLKIADGCDNFCSYCAIPFIRGRYRSTPIEELVKEAKSLSEQGVKELILVAQDTTRYGKDLYGRYALKELLSALIPLDFVKIRLMYAYPELIDDELIDMLSAEDKLAKYLDIPMQHIDDGVLKRMNRRSDEKKIRELIKRIKSRDSDIAIRSSFIVGFPGESEEEFAKLKAFIAEGNIDYAGFFTYSVEEGTAAAKHTGLVPKRIKAKREQILSAIQSQNIENNHKKYLGKTISVIYEGIDYDRGMFYGRNEQNSPEIDTKILFTADFPLDIGEYYNVKITQTGFNLEGKVVEI
ncbi:MAG: 30S ribosomal protein S12 methylthiotransferase RimO [Clostridia bacterium]